MLAEIGCETGTRARVDYRDGPKTYVVWFKIIAAQQVTFLYIYRERGIYIYIYIYIYVCVCVCVCG